MHPLAFCFHSMTCLYGIHACRHHASSYLMDSIKVFNYLSVVLPTVSVLPISPRVLCSVSSAMCGLHSVSNSSMYTTANAHSKTCLSMYTPANAHSRPVYQCTQPQTHIQNLFINVHNCKCTFKNLFISLFVLLCFCVSDSGFFLTLDILKKIAWRIKNCQSKMAIGQSVRL